MKKGSGQVFSIQSRNAHLLNLLEEHYYIELGNISIKVLQDLLDCKEVSFNDIYDLNIASHGLGQISDDINNDISYQVQFLVRLHQKMASSKFVITCGTIRYYESKCKEVFAPLILLPVYFDYFNNLLTLTNEPIINPLFIKQLKKDPSFSSDVFTAIESLNQYKVDSVFALDTLCMEIGNIVKLNVGTSNYFTLIEVEYADLVSKPNFFNHQRSITELKSEDVFKNYFNTVKGIYPTNIDQKYISLKAHSGESFVVNGALASGKTYTALNIMADMVANGKKILYVNHDLDNLSGVYNELKRLGLSHYTYTLTNCTIVDSSIEAIDVTKYDEFDLSLIDNLSRFKAIYDQKFHGYPYSYILEKLTERSALGFSDNVPIEQNLEREEVECIRNSLNQIEAELSKVDPYTNNVWRNLSSAIGSPSVVDTIKHTKSFYDITKNIIEELESFSKEFNLNEIVGLSDLNNLIEEIIAFEKVRPLPIWGKASFGEEANIATKEINEAIEINYDSLNYYKDNCVIGYIPGKMADLLKVITQNYYSIKDENSADCTYVDRLLKEKIDLTYFVESITKWSNLSLDNYERLKTWFNFESPTNACFIFLNKVLDYLKENKLDEEWNIEYLKSFSSFNTKYVDLKTKLDKLTNISDELKRNLDLVEINYKKLKELTLNKKPEKIIKKSLKKEAKKLGKKHFLSMVELVNNYLLISEEVISIIPAKTKLDIKEEVTWNYYLAFLNFIINLNPKEGLHFNSFIKKINLNADFKYSDLITILLSIKDNQKEVASITHTFDHYHIAVGGANFIDLVKSIKDIMPYLKKVLISIEEIERIFIKLDVIKTIKVLELINIDKLYLECSKQMEENKERYTSLFGDSFSSFQTNVVEIGRTIGYYTNFSRRSKNGSSAIDALFKKNSVLFAKLIELRPKFENLYNSWFESLRSFSSSFYLGMMSYQSESFKDVLNKMGTFVEKIDQVSHVYNIEIELDKIYKYNIKKFPDLIHNGTYSTDLANIYFYSAMNKYYCDMTSQGYDKYNITLFRESLKKYEEAELNYCSNNLYSLRNYTKEESSAKKKNNWDETLTYYSSILKHASSYKQIFLSDTDFINNVDISMFDLLIIDDAHLSSACKYAPLYSVKQVIILGDDSFNPSFINTLMTRVGDNVVIKLPKRYASLTSECNNVFSNNNQYITKLDSSCNTIGLTNVEKFVELITNSYLKKNKRINIIYSDKDVARTIYTILVNRFKEKYDETKINNILSKDIMLLKQNADASRVSEETYIWFDDFLALDESNVTLMLRNYCTSDLNFICFKKYAHKVGINEDINLKLNLVIGKIQPKEVSPVGIIKIMYDKLKCLGLNVEYGYGIMDLIIRTKSKHIGLLILGRRTHIGYSDVDDYQFYNKAYDARNWQIHTIPMETLYDSFDEIINKIITEAGNFNA